MNKVTSNLLISAVTFEILLLSLFFPKNVYGNCMDSLKNHYERIEPMYSGNCIGINRAESPFSQNKSDGDFEWIGNNGEMVKIGEGAPAELAILQQGVLYTYIKGKYKEIRYWSSETRSEKVCRDKILIKNLVSHIESLKIVSGEGITYQAQGVNHIYAENCQSTKKVYYAELTESDIRILNEFSSFNGVSNELTDSAVIASLSEIHQSRDKSVDEIISNFQNENIKSSLIYGAPGVGAEDLIYRLASRITKGNVPDWLKGWRIFSINIAKLGTEGLADVTSKKVSKLIQASSKKKVILFMEGIHQLIGLGTATDQKYDASEGFKTNLSSGSLIMIGTTTDENKGISTLQTHRSFYDLFHHFKLDPPTDKILIEMYRDYASRVMKKNNVQISDEILNLIIKNTQDYLPDEKPPRVGFKIIDKICAMNRNKISFEVTEKDVESAIGYSGNFKMFQDDFKDGENKSFDEIVYNFKEIAKKDIIGQNKAIESIQNGLFGWFSGTSPREKPLTFLLLGPSGVGKTYMAKYIAKIFKLPFLLIDLSNFTDESDINTFLGPAPGFVGYDENGGGLVQWMNQNPDGIIIFDEVDKAHPKITDMLAGLMWEGKLSGKNGHSTAYFKNGILFFTANYGSNKDSSLIDAFDIYRNKIPDPTRSYSGSYKEKDVPDTEEQLKDTLINQLVKDKSFGNHFAGRIGKENIVVCHHLNEQEAISIAALEIKKLKKRMSRIEIDVDERVSEFIGKRGIDFRFGARRILELVESLIKNKIDAKVIELRVKYRKNNDRLPKLKFRISLNEYLDEITINLID